MLDLRVLTLVPTTKDASVTRSVFQTAGIPCVCCSTLEEIHDQLDKGAGAILLNEEAILHHRKDGLVVWLSRQPPWSDLPVLVLARRGADSPAVAEAMDLLGNVTVLERPARVAALVSSVR